MRRDADTKDHAQCSQQPELRKQVGLPTDSKDQRSRKARPIHVACLQKAMSERFDVVEERRTGMGDRIVEEQRNADDERFKSLFAQFADVSKHLLEVMETQYKSLDARLHNFEDRIQHLRGSQRPAPEQASAETAASQCCHVRRAPPEALPASHERAVQWRSETNALAHAERRANLVSALQSSTHLPSRRRRRGQ